jgi:hypothetical protein
MEKGNPGYDVGVISVMLLGVTTRPNPQSTRGRGSPERCPPMPVVTPASRQDATLLELDWREHRQGGPGKEQSQRIVRRRGGAGIELGTTELGWAKMPFHDLLNFTEPVRDGMYSRTE